MESVSYTHLDVYKRQAKQRYAGWNILRWDTGKPQCNLVGFISKRHDPNAHLGGFLYQLVGIPAIFGRYDDPKRCFLQNGGKA